MNKLSEMINLKKYWKQILIIATQIFMFYGLPPFFTSFEEIGMVGIVSLITMVISSVMVFITKSEIRFCYPFFVALVYVPTIYIYCDKPEFYYVIWYFTVSFVGIGLGYVVRFLYRIVTKYKM